jgi:cytochrome P450
MRVPPSHRDATQLREAEFAIDPPAAYLAIRRRHGPVAPVLLDGNVPAWLVVSYREVHQVTSNPQLFGRDSRRWNLRDQIPADWPLLPFVAWDRTAVYAEGAEHQRRAGGIGDALDSVDHAELARICQRTADQLIDTFIGDGKADLIAQYARQLPIRVMARLYGLRDAEIPGLVADLLAADPLTAGAGGGSTGAREAYERGVGRMKQLVGDLRGQPGIGLASQLVNRPSAGGGEELAADMFMVLSNAQRPTADWIGNTLRLMLTDDHFSLLLQGGRSSADYALTEVLWKEPPVQNVLGRWAVRDCELGGRHIHEGDLVILGLAAANADPQVRPDSFSEAGANRAHMSFAHGEHSCPEAATEMAEIIARTAVEVLLDRMPDADLAVAPEALEWRPSAAVRGLASLPVTFTPATAASDR